MPKVTIEQKIVFGKALANLYIASQEGVSLEVSNTVCDIIEKQPPVTRLAFNFVMKDSPYNVRA